MKGTNRYIRMLYLPGKCKKLLAFMVTFAVLQGCQKWIDTGINQNPNEPEKVTMQTLLSFIEADVAYQYAGGIEMIATQSILIQQLDGIDRQLLPISNYFIDPLTLVWIWGDAYAEVLMDTKKLREQAVETGSPHNAGVSDVLAAFTLGQVTDAWGDVPWSEALKGSGIMQPRYDKQEDVYVSILAMLDRAIESLSAPTDPYGIKGDYFYDGDPLKWLKAAHALKARYLLHQSNRKGRQAYMDALEEVSLAFTGNEDNMQFPFGTGESESNPLYQFMRDRDDIRMGAWFVDLLKSGDDPRLMVFALPDQYGGYTGSSPGQADKYASRPGPAVAAPDASTYVINYTEVLFIKAESMFKSGYDEIDVRPVLVEAVASSLLLCGMWDELWLVSYNNKIWDLAGEDLYREIMTQKYIATFYQPEAYHSWRRTGYPVVPPNPQGATSEIPTRFPYPASEQVYNPNVPKGLTITDKVWWD